MVPASTANRRDHALVYRRQRPGTRSLIATRGARMKTPKATVIAAVMLITGIVGNALAKEATFNSVPANIVDAPVSDWRSVKRQDKTYTFQYKVSFSKGNGVIWIYELHKGRYWQEWRFSSKSKILNELKEVGWKNIRNVENIAYAGSQWGYMAIANWKNTNRECIVGKVLDNDNHSHDGGQGGTLQGYAVDCRIGAKNLFDEWYSWFKSFKRVPFGYNAALDK